jgi:hypothetical protein
MGEFSRVPSGSGFAYISSYRKHRFGVVQMKPEFIKSKGYPLSESQIIDFEKSHNCRFPNSFKDFLLLYNWVRFHDDCVFPIDNWYEDNVVSIDCIYGISSDENYNLFSRNRYLNDLPSGHLAVGENGVGDFVLISLLGNSFGNVFFWDCSSESANSLYLVSETFGKFIDSIFLHKW